MLLKLADALGTSVDDLLAGNPIADSTLASTRRFRRFQALECLAESDCDGIIRVIDAMVVKLRIRQTLEQISN